MDDSNKKQSSVDLKAVASYLNDDNDASVHQLPQKDKHSFKPNEELLQDTARVKSQRDLILSRIKKMEQSSSKVSQNVYDKVRRDYAMQLDNICKLLDEKKELLNKELDDLYLLREKVHIEINRHEEILEEARFRHYLEEFSEEQFKEVDGFESREIHNLQTLLSQVQSYITIHEELLDPEDLKNKSNEVTKTHHKDKLDTAQTSVTPPSSETLPLKEEKAIEVESAPQVQDSEPSLSEDNNLDEEEDTNSSALSENEEAFESRTLSVREESPSSEQKAESSVAEPEEASLPNQDDDILLPELSEQSSNELKDEKQKTSSDSEAKVNDDIAEEAELSSTEITLEPKEDSYFDQAAEAEKPSSAQMDDSKTLLRQEDQDKKDQNDADSILDVLDDIPLETDPYSSSPSKKSDEEPSMKVNFNDRTPPPVGKASTDVSTDDISSSASAQKGDYKLVVLEAEGEVDFKEYFLKDDNISIGRSPSNDIVLKAPKASRQHAAINKYKDQYLIIDLKSSNGVFVNGKKIDEYSLQEGDEVSVGGYKMSFVKV